MVVRIRCLWLLRAMSESLDPWQVYPNSTGPKVDDRPVTAPGLPGWELSVMLTTLARKRSPATETIKI